MRINSALPCCLFLIASSLIGEASEEPENRIRLRLPKTIYAATGIEMNVYFANVALVLNPANYAFDVICTKGVQQAERWTFTPAEGETGTFPFQLDVRDETNAVIARAKSKLRITSSVATPEREASLLSIGDSLTAGGGYTRRLLHLSESRKQLKLKLIGSRGSGPNRHEGYGGWTAQRHATLYTGRAREGEKKGIGSPFIYKAGDTLALDFARYCKDTNAGKAPDFVTLLLGCNDTFSATDETIESRIDTMLKHYDILIQMIHGVRKDTRIGALILVPPAASQDAFGANYKSSQTRWQYRRNQHRVMERMMKHFAGREKDRVWLVPANINLDCENNYPQREVARNANTALKVVRQSNGVHPATAGYYQIGDSIFCWLQTMLAE
ncbi:MAG: SGNH/GDSL hydrolase family protein [Planctomycetota bacterium]|jgi:lysophospholipase L1-like esterase|nr:SGNH/GDSL hydrolase family protein [Planctomycetota bacterium]